MSLRPETFEQDLKSRMGPEYRLRWSALTSTWNIEQQIGRGVWALPANDWDDTAIRARDGYALVCSVHPRPFFLCPECKDQLALPELAVGEVICQHCTTVTGQKTSYFAGYYPLCNKLIERVERTSPSRAKQWRREMNAKNARLVETQDRDWENYQYDLWSDWQARIADRPQIGAGGSIKSTGNWTTV